MLARVIAVVALVCATAYPSRAADLSACAEHLPYGAPSLPSHLRTTMVCHPGYAAMHDDDLLIPRWVAYRLTGARTLGCHARGNNFHADDALPKGQRATPADYRGSGYDKGHMAPAQDFAWSAGRMAESFSMVNMAPQLHGLNAGQWLRLEESVRAWAWDRGDVLVYVGPVIGPSAKRIGKNKVAIPGAFWKVLVDPVKEDAIAFAMPHRGIPKGELAPWQFTVSQIEQAGVTSLPMPAAIERVTVAALWPADRSAWNKAHKEACR